MRAALDDWHIGKVIAAYRTHPWHGAPLSQAIVAGWLGISQAYLSRMENGEPLQDLSKLIELAQLFSVPPELLWFRLPGRSASTLHAALSHEDLHELADQAAGQSLGLAAQAGDLRSDSALIESLRMELGRLAVDYVHTPVGLLVRDLVEARDQIFAMLEDRRRPAESRDLYVMGGVSLLMLAHASQNLGNSRAAFAQLRSAYVCADLSGYDALRAWSHGTGALLHEWTAQTPRAADLAAAGARLACSTQSRIRLAAIEGRSAARAGDADRARAALSDLFRAQEAANDTDEIVDLGGILSFPAAKQQYYIGSTLGLLGDHEAAEHHATAAIAAYESGPAHERSYGDEALARLDVVNSRVAAGDVDGAAEAAAPLLALPPDQRIEQLSVAARRTQGILADHPIGSSRPAADLNAALTEFQVHPGRPIPSLP
ncbi:helix-turn-helix transcriptional regulator [Nocardioides speluncae]|uniref:helix-turn-helix transcriptional regulator n=1 Tax=Nocardioides speluncae TaxID=2670337 RepID=UPI00137A49E3|nr:helix-turn-helix domain-containing protein [Nocardioides speluncae]